MLALALGLFSSGPDLDYSVEAARSAYPDVYRDHYEERLAHTGVRFFVATVNGAPTVMGPWAEGVREGRSNGAIDAIAAMRDALETGELGQNAYEHDLLDDLERAVSPLSP